MPALTHGVTKPHSLIFYTYNPPTIKSKQSPFPIFIMIVIFGLGDWMIKKLEIVGIIFTATNVIVFFDKRILPPLLNRYLAYVFLLSK